MMKILINTQGWLRATGAGHENFCSGESLKTVFDSWLLAEDLCVVQWHAFRSVVYPIAYNMLPLLNSIRTSVRV